MASVRKSGVVLPLIVAAGERPEVIAGHRRLACARQAGLKELPALVLTRELAPRELFLIAVLSNWTSRLEDLDKAVSIAKALEFGFSEEEVIRQILPALGLEAQKHTLEEYVQTRRLQAPLLAAVHAKQLPFRGVRLLGRLGAQDQIDFASCICAHAALTTQELVKTAEWLPDLLRASGCGLAAYLQRETLDALLNQNPSYVFFRELPARAGFGDPAMDGPLGALGVPLTPRRSIAVDPRYISLGAPVYLSTTLPNSEAPLQRLMLAQDTGGAIRGPVRADFFWGFGAEAGAMAGRMRQQGKMWVLLPRGYPLPVR